MSDRYRYDRGLKPGVWIIYDRRRGLGTGEVAKVSRCNGDFMDKLIEALNAQDRETKPRKLQVILPANTV